MKFNWPKFVAELLRLIAAAISGGAVALFLK